MSSVECLFRVEPLEIDLLNHPDVLTPRSQETIALMCAAIDSVAAGLPDRAEVLDMGCGSGVLSIAVAMKLRDREVSVTACDVLPEALALTRLNVDGSAAGHRRLQRAHPLDRRSLRTWPTDSLTC